MSAAALLALVAQYGPGIVTLITQLTKLAHQGNAPLSLDQLAELDRYATKTSEDFLRAVGVPVPPKPPAT